VNLTPDEEQQAIETKAAVDEFRLNPIVAETFRSLDKEIFKEFTSAKSADDALKVWAKSQAFQMVLNRFQGIKERGESAEKQRQTRNAREEQIRGAQRPR